MKCAVFFFVLLVIFAVNTLLLVYLGLLSMVCDALEFMKDRFCLKSLDSVWS